jgi:hypothetical protein
MADNAWQGWRSPRRSPSCLLPRDLELAGDRVDPHLVFQQPEHDEENRRQSSRTHVLMPAGSIVSLSRAGFAFP